MAVDTPVEPFGATAAGAVALVPEARLLTAPPPVGKYGVTEAQVEAWVAELSGAVAMRLTGWQRLTDEPLAPEVDSDRDQLVTAARAAIHNGAASYLEAARHPERADVNTTTYAGVLWDRYLTGLNTITGWLAIRLAEGAPGDDLEQRGGIASAFPAPTFVDGLRF